MDLYEFISPNFPSDKKEFPIDKKEQVEIQKDVEPIENSQNENQLLLKRIKELESLVDILQSERKEINTRLQSTEYQKASLETLIKELKDKQGYLIEQIKTVKDDKDSTLKSNIEALEKKIEFLLNEKQEILSSNKQLESLIETLKTERGNLEISNINLLKEKDKLIKELEEVLKNRDDQIADFKKSISLLENEMKEKQSIIERLTENNIDYKTKIEELKKDFEKSKQNFIFLLIAICFVMIITIIFIFSNKLPDKKSSSSKPSIDNSAEKSIENKELKQELVTNPTATAIPSNNTTTQNEMANISSHPEKSKSENTKKDEKKPSYNMTSKDDALSKKAIKVRTNGYQVSLKALTTEDLSKLNSALNIASEIDFNRAYLVTIRTNTHKITKDFAKEPKISVIYRNGINYETVKVTKSYYKKIKKNIEIKAIITNEKNINPIGIVIGPMNKNNLKITIV